MSAELEIDKLKAEVEKFKQKAKEAKKLKPDKGIETMFRLTSKNHVEFSAMADNKANILISINSIVLSILISVLYRKLEEYPHMVWPTVILTVVCLITIVLAILSTRPNVSKGVFTPDDIKNKKANLLFFGNFHGMSLQDYESGMKQMLGDADYLYSSMIKDIYFLGKVLGKKYKFLRLAFTVFMFGFVISVLAYIGAELFLKDYYTY
ncbi:Pycsar system effector family protein [Reichenbachiella versicolor]|uniref:Pycsar system effector family protein n=1 Tax=Reichenbachiella versicolor TaxID=1821036 RepID=UPI000D6EA2FD|nr:Pycsar system effector family protein [Reichenbachiella versicolor]